MLSAWPSSRGPPPSPFRRAGPMQVELRDRLAKAGIQNAHLVAALAEKQPQRFAQRGQLQIFLLQQQGLP